MATTTRKRATSKTRKSSAGTAADTGTFLDQIPLHRPVSKEPRSTERTALYGSHCAEASVTLVVRMTLETFGLFQSISGGTPTMPISDHLPFAGRDRYVVLGKKVRGVARKAIERGGVRKTGCEDLKPCGTCEFCSLFGYFLDGGNSRVRFLDFWSESARPEAPFMVGSRSLDPQINFIEDAEMVAPGTSFLGLVRIIQPSRTDLAHVLLALEEAGLEGIGSRTTHYGKFHVEPLAVLGGTWRTLGSAAPLLQRMNQGQDPEEALAAFISEHGDGLPALYGSECRKALRTLARVSPLHPMYGNESLREIDPAAQP